MKDAITSIPFCVGIMSVLTGGIFAVSNWRNLGGAIKEKLDTIKKGYGGTNIAKQHLQRVMDNTRVTLEGLNPDDPNLARKVERLKRNLHNINLENVSSNELSKYADEICNIEKEVIKTRGAMPVVKPEKGILRKTWHKLMTPYRAIKNTSVMKSFSQTSLGTFIHRSGGPLFAIIECAVEGFSEVIPAFKQGGLIAGVKQIGKSAVKVAASMSGYMLGEAVGAQLLGAAIGAAFGPIGAWVGRFVGGVVGGTLVSLPSIKLAKAITGKTEREKIQQKEIQEEAKQIQRSPEALKQLAARNLQLAQQELMSGSKSRETQEALKFCANIENIFA